MAPVCDEGKTGSAAGAFGGNGAQQPSPPSSPLDALKQAARRDSTYPIWELACIRRYNRVYAVSLDDDGTHVLVGGRDNCIALYELQDHADQLLDAPVGTGVRESMFRSKLMWEFESSDYVYTCALSDDLHYAVYAGRACAVTVVDARSGTQVQVPGGSKLTSVMSDCQTLPLHHGSHTLPGGPCPHPRTTQSACRAALPS